MEKVIIESPYGGSDEDVQRNVEYAQRCLEDSLRRGEAPIASHLLHTQVLDDNNPAERKMGIRAGLAWYGAADKIVFYVDLKMSKGMTSSMETAFANGVSIEIRTIL